MRKARLIVGRTTLGIIVLAGATGAAHAGPAESGPAAIDGELSPRVVAEGLAGEWDGQIEVRNAEGALSTSWVGVSARLAADGEHLELYYEGFAFGKPVEGAMVLSFAESHEALQIRDHAAGVQARCTLAEKPAGEAVAEASLAMLGSGAQGERDVRTVFSRDENNSWTIECQARQPGGEWSSMLLMSVSRLGGDRLSAASENFARSADLKALRSAHVTASVVGQ